MQLPEHALVIVAQIAGFYEDRNPALSLLENRLGKLYEQIGGSNKGRKRFDTLLHRLRRTERELYEKRRLHGVPRKSSLLDLRFDAPVSSPEYTPRLPAIEAEVLYNGTFHLEDPLHAQLIELKPEALSRLL